MSNLLIVWTKKHDLGIPIIDEQHRGIVSVINSLFYFIGQNQGTSALKPTIIMIEQYSAIHFQTEERLMESIEYPELFQHRQLHNDLLEKQKGVIADALESRSPQALLVFLKSWWIEHINKQDRLYAPCYFAAKGETV